MISVLAGLPAHARGFVRRHVQINWALADQAIVSGANFLTALIVARHLGIEAFGAFSIAWIIVLFTQSFQMALVLSPMLSIGPKQERAGAYYASLLVLQAGFALASSALGAGVAVVAGSSLGMGEASGALALPLALAVATTQVHEFFRRFCFARQRPFEALRLDVARYGALITGLLLLFVSGHGSVRAALLVVSAGAVAGSLPALAWFPRPVVSSQSLAETLRRHWSMARWLLPSALMQWVGLNVFTLALGAVEGPAAVGILRATQNLLGVTHVLFQALSNWAPVRAAHVYATEGVEGLRAFTRRLHLVTGSCTAVVALVLGVPAGFWLRLLYGGDYAAYGWVVVGYGVAYVLMALAAPYRYAFSATENTRPVFIGNLAATIFSLASLYPLIAGFGIAGAIMGVIGVQICLVAVYLPAFARMGND